MTPGASPTAGAPVRPSPGGAAARRSGRGTWWAAFVLLGVLGGWWTLASPLFSLPDEPAHATYAAGAVRGELYQEAESVVGRYVEVPSDFADAGIVIQCFAFNPDAPAGCAGDYGVAGDATAEVATTAGRYPPAYYLAVGLPSLVLDGAAAVYAMRLVTVLLTAALLASAVVSASVGARTSWPVLGVVVATTPMVLFLTGGVNPQAPEIAAGTLLWAAGAALLGRGRVDGTDPAVGRLVLRVCVAAAVLAVVRPIAPLWLAMTAVVLLLGVARRDDVVLLLRRRGLQVGIGLVAALGVSTVVWVLTADALAQQQVPTYADLPADRAVLLSAQDWDGDLLQMVGVFGWLDTNPPAFVHLAWLAVLLGLVVLGAAAATWRGRLTLLGLVGLGLVVPVVLEVQAYRESAFAWQGRYVLPLLVGVPVLAGHLLDRGARGVLVPRPRRLVAVMTWVVVVCHVGAFVGVLNRYLRGVDAFWVLDPPAWDPPLPTAVLVAGYTLTLVVGAVAVVRGTPAGGPGTGPAAADAQGRPVPVDGDPDPDAAPPARVPWARDDRRRPWTNACADRP